MQVAFKHKEMQSHLEPTTGEIKLHKSHFSLLRVTEMQKFDTHCADW